MLQRFNKLTVCIACICDNDAPVAVDTFHIVYKQSIHPHHHNDFYANANRKNPVDVVAMGQCLDPTVQPSYVTWSIEIPPY